MSSSSPTWFASVTTQDAKLTPPATHSSASVPSFIPFNNPQLHYTIESLDTPIITHKPLVNPEPARENRPQPLPSELADFSCQSIRLAHPELCSQFPSLSNPVDHGAFDFEAQTSPQQFQPDLKINNAIRSKRLLRHITFATSTQKLGPPSQQLHKEVPYTTPRCPNITIQESTYTALLPSNPAISTTFTKGSFQSHPHSSTQVDLQAGRDEKRILQEQALVNPPKVDERDKFPVIPDLKVFFKQIQPSTFINYRERLQYTDHINPVQYSRSNCTVFYLIRRTFSKFQERKNAFEFYQRRYTHERGGANAMAVSHGISQDVFPYENPLYNDPYFDSEEYFHQLFDRIQSYNERSELTWSQDDLLNALAELDYLRLDAMLLCGASLFIAPQIQSNTTSHFSIPSSFFYSPNKHALFEQIQSDQYLNQFPTLALIRTIKVLFLNHHTHYAAELFCQLGLYYQHLIHTTRYHENLILSPQPIHYFLSIFPHFINQHFIEYNNFTILNLLTTAPWTDNQSHLVELLVQQGASPYSPDASTPIPNPIADLVKQPGNLHTLKYLITHGFPTHSSTLPVKNSSQSQPESDPRDKSDYLTIYNAALAYYKPTIAIELEKAGFLPKLTKEEVIKTLCILLNKEDTNDLTFDYTHIALDLNQPGRLMTMNTDVGKKMVEHYSTLQSSTLECLVDDFTAYMQYRYSQSGPVTKLSNRSENSMTLNRPGTASSPGASALLRPDSANDLEPSKLERSTSYSIAPHSITQYQNDEKIDEVIDEHDREISEKKDDDEQTEKADSDDTKTETTNPEQAESATDPPDEPGDLPQVASTANTSGEEIVATTSEPSTPQSLNTSSRRRLNPVAMMMAKGPTSPASTGRESIPGPALPPAATLPASPSTQSSALAPPVTSTSTQLTAGPLPEALPTLPVSPIRPNIFEAIRTMFIYPQHQLFALDVLTSEFRYKPTDLAILAKTYPSLLVHQGMRSGFDDEAYYQGVLNAGKLTLNDFYSNYCTNVYQFEYYLHFRSLHNFQQRTLEQEEKIDQGQPLVLLHDDVLQQNQPHIAPSTEFSQLFTTYLTPHTLQSLYSIHHAHQLSKRYPQQTTRVSPLIKAIRDFDPYTLDALFLLHSASLTEQRQLIFTFDVLDRLPHCPTSQRSTQFNIMGHNVPIHNCLLWDYIEINSQKTLQTLQMMSALIKYTSHDSVRYTPIFCRESLALSYLAHVRQKMHGGKPAPRSIPSEPLSLALSFGQTPCSINHIGDRIDVPDLQNSKEFSTTLFGYEASRLYRGYHLIHIICQIPSLDSLQFIPSLPPQPQSISTPIIIPGCETTQMHVNTLQLIPGKLFDAIYHYYNAPSKYLPNLTERSTATTGYINWVRVMNLNDSFNNSPLMFLVNGVNNTNTIKNALEKGQANVTHINSQKADVVLLAQPEYKALFHPSLAPHLQQIKDWILAMTDGKTDIDFRLALDPKTPPPSTPVTVLRNPREKNNGYFSTQTETYYRNWTKKPIISHLITAFNVLSPDIFAVLLMFRQHFKHVKHPFYQQIYPTSMVQFDDPECFDHIHYWDTIFDKLNALIIQFQSFKISTIKTAATALHHDLFPFFLQADPHYFPQLLPKIYQFTTQYDFHMVELLILCGCDPNTIAVTVSQYLPFSLPPIYYIFEYHGVIGTGKILAQPPIITASDMTSTARFSKPAIQHTPALSSTASTFSKSLDPPGITPAYLQRVVNALFDDSLLRTLLVLLRYRAQASFQCPTPTSPEHTHTHQTTLFLAATKFYSKVLFANPLAKHFQRTCFDRGLPFHSNFSDDHSIAEQYPDILMKILRFVAANIDVKLITQRGCSMELFSHVLLDAPNLDLHQNMILSTFATALSQNKSAQDSFGNTMLHYLSKHHGNASIIQKLVSSLSLNIEQKNAKQRSPLDYAPHSYYLSIRGHTSFNKDVAREWLSMVLTDSPEINYNLLYPVPVLKIATGRLDNVNHPALSPLGHQKQLDMISPWSSINLTLGQTHLTTEYHPSLIIPFNQYRKFRQSSIFHQIFSTFGAHPFECILTLQQLMMFYQNASELTKHSASVVFGQSADQTNDIYHPNAIQSFPLSYPHLSFQTDANEALSVTGRDQRLEALVPAFISIVQDYQAYCDTVTQCNAELTAGDLTKYQFPIGMWLSMPPNHPLISLLESQSTTVSPGSLRCYTTVHPDRALKAIQEVNLPLLEAYLILGLDPNTLLYLETNSPSSLSFTRASSTPSTHSIPFTMIFYHIHPLIQRSSQITTKQQLEYLRLLLRYNASAVLPTQAFINSESKLNAPVHLTGVSNQYHMYQSYFYYLVDSYVSDYMKLVSTDDISADTTSPQPLSPTVQLKSLRRAFVEQFTLLSSHYLHLYNLHNSRGDRLFSDDYPPPQCILTSFAHSNIFHILSRLSDLDSTHHVIISTIHDFLAKLQTVMDANTNLVPLSTTFGDNFLLRFYYSQQNYTLNSPLHYLVQRPGNYKLINKILTVFNAYFATKPTISAFNLAYTPHPLKLCNSNSLYPIDLTSHHYAVALLDCIAQSSENFPTSTPAMNAILTALSSRFAPSTQNNILTHLFPRGTDTMSLSQASTSITENIDLFPLFFSPITVSPFNSTTTITNNLLSLIFNDLQLSNHTNKAKVLTALIYTTAPALAPPLSFNIVESIHSSTSPLNKTMLCEAWLPLFTAGLHLLNVWAKDEALPFSSLSQLYCLDSRTQQVIPYMFVQMERRNLTNIILQLLLTTPSTESANYPSFPISPLTKFPAAIIADDLYTMLTYFFSRPESSLDTTNFDAEQTWKFVSSLYVLHSTCIRFIHLPTVTLIPHPTNTSQLVDLQHKTTPFELSLPLVITTSLLYVLKHTELHKQAQTVVDLLIHAVTEPHDQPQITPATADHILFQISSASHLNLVFDALMSKILPTIVAAKGIDFDSLMQSTDPIQQSSSLLHLSVQRPGNSKFVEYLIKTYPNLLKSTNDAQQSPNEVALQDYQSIFPPTLPPRVVKAPPVAPRPAAVSIARRPTSSWADRPDFDSGRDSTSRDSISLLNPPLTPSHPDQLNQLDESPPDSDRVMCTPSSNPPSIGTRPVPLPGVSPPGRPSAANRPVPTPARPLTATPTLVQTYSTASDASNPTTTNPQAIPTTPSNLAASPSGPIPARPGRAAPLPPAQSAPPTQSQEDSDQQPRASISASSPLSSDPSSTTNAAPSVPGRRPPPSIPPPQASSTTAPATALPSIPPPRPAFVPPVPQPAVQPAAQPALPSRAPLPAFQPPRPNMPPPQPPSSQ